MKTQIERFRVVIAWSDQYNLFLAEMPEIPGIVADGKTQEEALANVRSAAEAWIDVCAELGRPIPAPEHQEIAA